MKPSTTAFVIAVLLAVGASFGLGYMIACRNVDKPSNRPDTAYITEWVRDTIYEPKDSVVYRTKIVPLPVHDTTALHDTTIVRDSVLVEIPITEKTYASENYRATISGYDPKLVDIWVKKETQVIHIPYHNHWNVTVGPQAGYGFTPNGWKPYAGIGITAGYSF